MGVGRVFISVVLGLVPKIYLTAKFQHWGYRVGVNGI